MVLDVLEELHTKRAKLANQTPSIDAEYERIVRKKENHYTLINALDMVIKSFVGDVEPIPPNDEETVPPKDQLGSEVTGGLKKLARDHFHELPDKYTKKDVLDILMRERPNENINANTLIGVMRNLVDKNLAEVETAAIGRSAQIYRKVSVTDN